MNNSRHDRLHHYCRPCACAIAKERRERDPEAARAAKRRLYEQSPERHRAASSRYREANLELCREHARQWKEANPERNEELTRRWRAEHPDRYRAYAMKRVALRRCATPAWADATKIDRFYTEMCAFGERYGVEVEGDHIVPLNSPYVCGLHTQDNLQVLPAKQNSSKGNRHWPDMPHPLAPLNEFSKDTL